MQSRQAFNSKGKPHPSPKTLLHNKLPPLDERCGFDFEKQCLDRLLVSLGWNDSNVTVIITKLVYVLAGLAWVMSLELAIAG